MKGGAASLDGVLDGAQEHVVVEWLRQELDGSSLHGLYRHRNVSVTRDEDDRHVHPTLLAKMLFNLIVCLTLNIAPKLSL